MTPQQRARAVKILRRYEAIEPCEHVENELTFIAVQIEEAETAALNSLLKHKGECGHKAEFFVCNKCVEQAEREAILDDRMRRTADELYKLSYQSGFNAAREKAKGILKGYWQVYKEIIEKKSPRPWLEEIADRIGKMEPEK